MPDDSHPEGAFAVLLSNLRSDHVQFDERERRECFRVLYDDMLDRLQSYRGHAALNLRHTLVPKTSSNHVFLDSTVQKTSEA